MSEIVVLYHKDCLDGYGAAWAAYKLFGEEATYIPVDAGAPPPLEEIPEQSYVYSVDVAFRPAHLEPLADRVAHVTIIDHHATAEEWYDGYEAQDNVTLILEMKHSAAVLSWKFFHREKKIPALLHYIEDRDLWKWELPDSEAVLLAVDSYPYTFGNLDRLMDDIDRLKGEGQAILKYRNQMLALQLKNAHLMHFTTPDGMEYKVPAVNCSIRALTSEACHDLLKLYPEVPFVASYRRAPDGTWNFSLRSSGDHDVAAFAAKFGGGGHKQAAGMTLDTLPPVSELEDNIE